MLLCRHRCVSHLGHASKHFSNWLPGKLFSPGPLRELDLHAEYVSRLDEAIAEKLSVLSSKFELPPDPYSIKKRLLADTPSELSVVRKQRLMAAKQPGAPTAAYNRFLRALYMPEPDARKVTEALSQLPGAAQNKQALYVDAVHFERLMAESLSNRQLCTVVVPLAEAAGLPTTARERAQLLLHLHASGQPWRETFARFWPEFVLSQDVGAWNMLLRLSYMTHSSSIWSKVNDHFPMPDRITLMLRLKYNAQFNIHTAREIFGDFRKRGFVVDTAILTLFMSALLRSRRAEDVAMAEAARDQMLKQFSRTKVIKRNSSQLARVLKALDNVNVATGSRYSVPLVADAELFESFVVSYISTKQYAAAIEVFQSMARNGYFSRHLALKLVTKGLDSHLLEQLLYLCCDIEVAQPGFMSESLIYHFVRAMCDHGQSYEDAVNILTRNRVTGRSMPIQMLQR